MDGVLSELQALVELVKTLPHLALWVAIGFWAYKVIIIGSIYGVIRFCADRAYKAYIARLEQKKYSITEVKDWKGVGVIGDCEKDMATQLKRLRYRWNSTDNTREETSSYIHQNGVMVLEDALNAYFADPKNSESLKRVQG